MSRMRYGSRNHGAPVRGSWGDCYLIEKHYEPKYMSCSQCINYCREDKSCVILPVYPPVDGYDYCRRCGKYEV